MTFRQCFYISIAAHIMIFGSALAIAQHSGAWLLSPREVITVALVPGGGQVAGAEKGTTTRQQQKQAILKTREADTTKSETPAEVKSVTAKVPESSPVVINKSGEGSNDLQLSSQSTAQGVSGGSGDGVPGVWTLLAAAIERTKNYPRLARERGIEGVVRLRFKLAPSGAIEKVELVESSGSDILDKASVGAVYRAAPLPFVSGWVEMPMKYVLK
jgi:TonB family protein